MKSKEKLSSMTSVRFDGIYNGKEAEVGHGGCVCLYIYIYVYVCMYICMYVCIYLVTYWYVYVYIYMFESERVYRRRNDGSWLLSSTSQKSFESELSGTKLNLPPHSVFLVMQNLETCDL